MIAGISFLGSVYRPRFVADLAGDKKGLEIDRTRRLVFDLGEEGLNDCGKWKGLDLGGGTRTWERGLLNTEP
jgi:hypothetical protein